MPNDAKLGLVVGVGLVIVVAVIFFQKDLAAAKSDAGKAAVRGANSGEPRNQLRPVRGQPTAQTAQAAATTTARQHTVKAGDTLFTLAQTYYGDGDKFVEIYRANRQVLKTPDELPAGAVLVIPSVPESAAP